LGHAENKRERIETIERLLQVSWLTPTELAEKLGCDRTTIHRDLNEIRGRYDLDDDGKGRHHLDPMQYVSNVKLSTPEALSIYLALRRFIRQTSKAPDFFVSAIQKMAIALRHPNLTTQLAESSITLETERRAAAEHTTIWKTLLRGWIEKIVVRVRYQPGRSNENHDHEFEPYLFEPAVQSHGVYVVGWSRTREDIRTFKVDRIQRATLTTARFEKSEDLKPDILLKHAWGIWYGEELTRVELLFVPEVANRVQETIWHPSQKMTLLEDGSLHWSVEIAGTLELIAWIRGWGHEVRVLAPENLRREIAKSLRAAADLYEM
jgi:predicted DNA-binding transcriptional regulator YafY